VSRGTVSADDPLGNCWASHTELTIMHPNVVYPWYPLQRGGHIHETQLADNRALAFTFADADGTLWGSKSRPGRVTCRDRQQA
jgi:hypothetical protein